VFGGLTRPLAAALVAGAAVTAVLAGPSSALACSGGTSAVSVYSECLPNGGGGKHSSHHARSGSTATHTSGTGISSTPTVSRRAKKVLKRAGRHRRVLTALQATAPPRMFQGTGPAEAQSAPTAFGSAFDLGSGPTALLVVLIGTVIVLLAAGGLRGWRRSHRA